MKNFREREEKKAKHQRGFEPKTFRSQGTRFTAVLQPLPPVPFHQLMCPSQKNQGCLTDRLRSLHRGLLNQVSKVALHDQMSELGLLENQGAAFPLEVVEHLDGLGGRRHRLELDEAGPVLQELNPRDAIDLRPKQILHLLPSVSRIGLLKTQNSKGQF